MLPYIRNLLGRARRMFIAIAKVMLPVMIVVKLAQDAGLVDVVGRAIAPAMAWLDLPPEAGIIWTTTVFIGIYGGIATLSGFATSLELSVAQLSVLCAMMLFTHALPVEQAIVRRAGAGFWSTGLLRVAAALAYGAAVSWTCRLTGLLSDPVSLGWLRGGGLVDAEADAGWLAWMASTAFSLALTATIIVGLLVLLDAFERFGITRRITAASMPVLRLSGLDARVAPVTTVGVLLGLTYGGALIIDEAHRQQFDARVRFLALAWLSLSHALIEDTLLMLALGADFFVVLVGRVALTLAIVATIARLWPPRPGASAATAAGVRRAAGTARTAGTRS